MNNISDKIKIFYDDRYYLNKEKRHEFYNLLIKGKEINPECGNENYMMEEVFNLLRSEFGGE